MLLPGTFAAALVLSLLGMVCWGSNDMGQLGHDTAIRAMYLVLRGDDVGQDLSATQYGGGGIVTGSFYPENGGRISAGGYHSVTAPLPTNAPGRSGP